MKALVTGGSGFVGLYLVEQLVQQGVDVRVFCRSTKPEFKQLGVAHFEGDLRDKQKIEQAVTGVDAVFHVAGVPGLWGSWKHFHEINYLGTKYVIEACRKHHVPKLIYTSSPSVIFDGSSHKNVDETYPYPQKHLCHYSHSKALGEQAVLQANDAELSTAAIRPHLVWGPRDHNLIPKIIHRAAHKKLRKIGNGQNLISVSYVENVAAAHIQLAQKLTPNSAIAGQAYFINDPEPVNLWQWVNSLLQIANISPIKRSIPARTAAWSGHFLELAYSLLPLKGEPAMTRFLAAQLSKSHFYSIEKAQRDFGYQPIVSIDEGLEKWRPELKKIANNI